MGKVKYWTGLGIALGVITLFCTSTCATPTPIRAALASLAIYDDALATGWGDWSWNVTDNLNNPAPIYGGSKSIAVTFTQGWDGFKLGRSAALSLAGYDTLRFWIHGGTSGGQTINVQVRNASSAVDKTITASANTWQMVDVPLAGLAPFESSEVVWFNATNHTQAIFYLDDLTFVNLGLPTPSPVPPGTGPALSVDASADRRAISPYIYGMNWAEETLAAELRLPVRRWGGNATTRYNWQNDTNNRAFDWFFENIPNDNTNPAQLPNGSASDKFVEQDRRTNTKTFLTIPLIGWTPKARAVACGFSVAKYGAQQQTDSWRPDCGNGKKPDGSNVTGNDPTDTSVAITPAFAQSWMQHLIGKYGAAANGGVAFYNLDNEPMLWHLTHRDVHPTPVSYDEIRDRTYQYAAAIKVTDPNALVLGPALWGWSAYFASALDTTNNYADRAAHGNTPFTAWYLQQLRAHEQANGTRILDYLDLHFYPQATNVFSANAGDATTQALRLRSTRALWDPTYADESWIAQTAEGPSVRLIPRMKDWVNANYPGTKIALGEYNWGALNHINGALAQADILGILGRESVDLATLWDPPTTAQPGAFAFRVYRNYDGAGKAFGETSVRATSANQAQLAIYAAQRAGDNAVTVIVINKTSNALVSNVALAGFTASASAQVFRYSADNLAAIVRQPDQSLTAGGFSATFPANSITLFVFPASQAGANLGHFLPMIRRCVAC